MSRLVNIDDLKGCAIIRPTTHEEMSHILACKGLVKHDDIPTAYNVDKVVEDLKYYLETNEENGVVYIPKFMIEKMIKVVE